MEDPIERPWLKKSKSKARRHEDGYWTWPKALSFMGTEEFLMLPKDIREMVFSFMATECTWDP